MRCEEVREQIPAYVDGGRTDLGVRRHLATCRDCQAELARYQSLVGALGALRERVADPPPHLVSALVAIPSSQDRLDGVKEHLQRNRAVYVGGLAVAAAGAAGAAVWRARARRVAVA